MVEDDCYDVVVLVVLVVVFGCLFVVESKKRELKKRESHKNVRALSLFAHFRSWSAGRSCEVITKALYESPNLLREPHPMLS